MIDVVIGNEKRACPPSTGVAQQNATGGKFGVSDLHHPALADAADLGMRRSSKEAVPCKRPAHAQRTVFF
jgi:hypothetical protein